MARLSQPDARPSAVFVDEHDALTGQNIPDQRERSGVSSVPTNLDVGDCIPMKTRSSR